MRLHSLRYSYCYMRYLHYAGCTWFNKNASLVGSSRKDGKITTPIGEMYLLVWTRTKVAFKRLSFTPTVFLHNSLDVVYT
ncbi:predicted protein [Lichtheimia corymbifera JMRC:FSU:9682]|uniref:Uncharacterized protein n=1 Tax=Lichtheimia corymbifera JMRC:FSU:9682 TaxID=1263082 RepID=A0A068S6P4_9FUNG|nr:predicted protein [Lichtheimia corymbifera JMRC:FSU:9682]